jgi:hypothetical protein
MGSGSIRKLFVAALAALLLPVSYVSAQDKPINIVVTPATAAPPVSITLGARHGHATPHRTGCNHTGGGNIDVAQPSSDTVVITMSGVAVSYCGPNKGMASWDFDLTQCFEITFDDPKVKKAKMIIEGRVIGVLRSHPKGGCASYDNACVSIGCGNAEVISLCVPPHTVCCGENLGVNDHDGPVTIPIAAGTYDLHQTFTIAAHSPKCLLPHKAPSAEFAPDPALDPLWISAKEPFHGIAKKDFGYQVTIRVAEDTDPEPAAAPMPKK